MAPGRSGIFSHLLSSLLAAVLVGGCASGMNRAELDARGGTVSLNVDNGSFSDAIA